MRAVALLVLAQITALVRIEPPAAAVAEWSAIELSNGGGWAYITQPAAVEYTGTRHRTYFGYTAPSGNIVAQDYDHDDGTSRTFALHVSAEKDWHSSPSFLMLPSSKRIAAFYTGHDSGGPWYRVSTNPEDITAWGPEILLPGGGAYASSLYLSAVQRFYFLHRSGDWKWKWMTNVTEAGVINGTGWTAEQQFLSSSYGDLRPYPTWWSDGVDTIHFVVHEIDGGNSKQLFYMRYNALDGTFRKANGTLIATDAGLPIATGQMDVIYTDPDGTAPRDPDIVVDASGRPVVLFVTTGGGAAFHYARWDGAAWQVRKVHCCAGATDPADKNMIYGALDRLDPNRCYLSRQTPDPQVMALEQWETTDGGQSFRVVSHYTSGTALFPLVPRGRTGTKLPVLWMGGADPLSTLAPPPTYYTNFSTRILTVAP